MTSTETASSTPMVADVSSVVVDALPYIDLGYDEPGVREAVSDYQKSE